MTTKAALPANESRTTVDRVSPPRGARARREPLPPALGQGLPERRVHLRLEEERRQGEALAREVPAVRVVAALLEAPLRLTQHLPGLEKV